MRNIQLYIIFPLVLTFTICACHRRDKFEECYNKAVSFQEQKKLKESLRYYIQATEYKTNDRYSLAMDYYSQSEIYERVFFDWNECSDRLKKAASLFNEIGDTNMYYTSTIKLAGILTLHNKNDEAFILIKTIDKSLLGSQTLSDYYTVYLFNLISNKSMTSDVKDILNEYVSAVINNKERLIIAWGYSYIGDKEKALQYIPLYNKLFLDDIDKVKYYKVLSNIYENLNDMSNALIAYKNYTQALYDMSSKSFNDELQYTDDLQNLNSTHSEIKKHYFANSS